MINLLKFCENSDNTYLSVIVANRKDNHGDRLDKITKYNFFNNNNFQFFNQ